MSAGERREFALDQLLDELVAEALDVHRPAAGEVPQRLLALGPAGEPAGAAGDRLALDAARPPSCTPGSASAARPGASRLDSSGRCFEHDAHHLGNHIARAAHDHRVADAHVLAMHLVDVVQSDVADRHAADEHRLQPRDRRQRPGAPDLKLDAANDGGRLLRGKLVRDRPARRARHEAQPLLVRAAIELVDDAVDLVRRASCAARPCRDSNSSSPRRRCTERASGQIGRPQPSKASSSSLWRVGNGAALRPTPRRRRTCPAAGAVAVMRGSSCRRLPAAELRGLTNTFSPRSRASRFMRSNPASGMNTSPRTSSTAGALALQPLRHRADRAHVGGHVLTLDAIAAGRGALELAVAINHRDRQSVELRLRHDSRARPATPEALVNAAVEGHARPRRVKALSSDSIGTLWITSPKAATGAPETRCVGESGVIRSGYSASSARSSIISWSYSASGTLRLVELVVALVVMRDLRAQLGDAAFGVPSHGRRRSAERRGAALRLSRRAAMRLGVSGPPRSSCSAPSRRSLRLRAWRAASRRPQRAARARAARRTGSGRRSAAVHRLQVERARACSGSRRSAPRGCSASGLWKIANLPSTKPSAASAGRSARPAKRSGETATSRSAMIRRSSSGGHSTTGAIRRRRLREQ